MCDLRVAIGVYLNSSNAFNSNINKLNSSSVPKYKIWLKNTRKNWNFLFMPRPCFSTLYKHWLFLSFRLSEERNDAIYTHTHKHKSLNLISFSLFLLSSFVNSSFLALSIALQFDFVRLRLVDFSRFYFLSLLCFPDWKTETQTKKAKLNGKVLTLFGVVYVCERKNGICVLF